MKKSAVIIALALGVSAWTALAQNQDTPPPAGDPPPPRPGGPGHPGHFPPPLRIVTALDANGDGVIDATEIANAPAALRTLDKNGDGKLTREEYMPPRPPRRDGPGGPGGPPPGADPQGAPPSADGSQPTSPGGPPHRPVPPIVAALDLNHDGVIDADEIAAASESLKKLDKNGDGQLTPDEFRPPHPGGRGGPGGRDQPLPPPPGN